MSAPQPAVPTATEPSTPLLNPDVVRSLGVKLQSDFQAYERDRRLAEMRWAQNLRQYVGEYDPDIKQSMPADRSKAYPKLTRVKCVSMVARLMNLLFPASEKNWGIEASPVPNLAVEDLQSVLDGLMEKNPETALNDEMITNAVMEFARTRARNLEIEVADQLTELGGGKMLNYIALCKQVVKSGVMFGMGILKGPMVRSRSQRRWQLAPDGKTVQAVDTPIMVPFFEFVSVWDYYPDMSAKYLHQMDGQFQRIVMSRQQLRKLADNSQFMGETIKRYLAQNQTGNYRQRQHETEMRMLGPQLNTPSTDERKYEVIVWDGALSAHYLHGCGVRVPESQMGDTTHAIVWCIDNLVIRADLNPWVRLGETDPPNSYHHFVFEDDETNLCGTGLPQIMRDSQLGMAAAARMLLDNASIAAGVNVEVNENLLVPGTDTSAITPYKVWVRDDDSPATANLPAVRPITFDAHIPELREMVGMFQQFADQETFVGPATGGDMEKMPSEPFRTAQGASMLRADAALPFKDVVRNYDVFTESFIGSMIVFNKHFNQKQSVKGDFQPVARGSTSLIAKEVRGAAYDQLVQSLAPEERIYYDWEYLARERAAVRDMDPQVLASPQKVQEREDAQAAASQEQQQQAREMFAAEIRKLLSEAVKNVSQADKNAAGAEVTKYQAMVDGLEKGVTPVDVADARAGGGVPEGVVVMHAAQHPKTEPKAAGGSK